MKKKFNTELFSTGAEFFVLSKLLLNHIEAHKSYVNFEGYDLIAVNPRKNISAKIQVKSKNHKGDTGHYLNSDDKVKSDFYIFVQSNAYIKEKDSYRVVEDSEAPPKFFVMDYKTVLKLRSQDKNGGLYIKLNKKNIPNLEDYEGNLKAIKSFLEIDKKNIQRL